MGHLFSRSYLHSKNISPKIEYSFKLTPIFEGKLKREDTPNNAHCKDKWKVEGELNREETPNTLHIARTSVRWSW